MRKKDYEILAKGIKKVYDEVEGKEREVVERVIKEISKELEKDNERFSPAMFWKEVTGILKLR